MLAFFQSAFEISTLGCIELASLFAVAYYVWAKTRVPAIIANLFPNIKTVDYRSSLVKLKGSDFSQSQESKAGGARATTFNYGIGIKNMLTQTPHAGFRPHGSPLDYGNYFQHVAQCLRSKKYEYKKVDQFVRDDPNLLVAIKKAAEQILREKQVKDTSERNVKARPEESIKTGLEMLKKNDLIYQNILREQQKRAEHILKDMSSTLNNLLLGITSWVLYKLLPLFLRGVLTNTKQIEMLRNTAKVSPDVPLIFLPLHRSHLDYVMLTFILTNNDIRSPLVAAGNNLQIPVFGGLLRGLGAFFIKRKIDPVVGKKDTIYRAVLHLYLQHALKLGHNVEFFIEGGRTRTGKPCMPKGGVLSVIVNAFIENSIPDALLVPVSINYERLVDGNFVYEQKGEKKVPESFGKAVSGIWKALRSNYGFMRIDFNEPYSLRELVQSYNKVSNSSSVNAYKPSGRKLQHNISTSSLYGTDVVCEEHRALVDSISREVVYDCANATSIMSTNVVAFLLLTSFRKGGLAADLAKSLDELRSHLTGRKDVGFAGDSLDIINYACDLLEQRLITRSKSGSSSKSPADIFIQPTRNLDAIIELSYYSNMLTPHFALQSILMTTFHQLLPKPELSNGEEETDKNEMPVKKSDNKQPGVARDYLFKKALENCDIYRYEYILNKPTRSLETELEKALDELVEKELIKLANSDLISDRVKATMKFAKRLEEDMLGGPEWDTDSDDNSGIGENEKMQDPDLFLEPSSLAQQRSVCEILAPIAYTYRAVAKALDNLCDNALLENDYVQLVVKGLIKEFNEGKCPYGESVSTDSVRNCLKLLEKWSVIEISNREGLRVLSLSLPYGISTESLTNVKERFEAVVPNYEDTLWFS